jgi:hypothetical protein
MEARRNQAVVAVYRRESGGCRVVHHHADRLLHPVAGPAGQGTTAEGAVKSRADAFRK